MTHIWLRHEERAHEQRSPLTPDGARSLIAKGAHVTVEDSPTRILDTEAFCDAGCTIAETGSWRDAPQDAWILGLKELPADGTPLHHRHIMFGHAFKGQHSGRVLLDRFKAGGGALYDLEYLTDPEGRRVAAFGYWAGYAGAAVSLLSWAAQNGVPLGALGAWPNRAEIEADLREALDATGAPRPRAIIIGALGRVGAGAADLCDSMGVAVTKWDMAETAHGGLFPEILTHDLFFNCILARPETPVFVPKSALTEPRALRVIGDIACDPDSDYNPVPLYDQATSWDAPALRVHEDPPLDIMAIDNLPSLMPLESTLDFAGQLLPHLVALNAPEAGVWGRAHATFRTHL